jgi:hypothetical protein
MDLAEDEAAETEIQEIEHEAETFSLLETKWFGKVEERRNKDNLFNLEIRLESRITDSATMAPLLTQR